MTFEEEGDFRPQAEEPEFPTSPPAVAEASLDPANDYEQGSGVDFSPAALAQQLESGEPFSCVRPEAPDALREEGGHVVSADAFFSDADPSDESPPEREEAGRILGIRLRKAGQVHFFPDAGHTVRVGSKIVVQLEQGLALGEVECLLSGVDLAHGPVESDSDDEALHGKVLRLATAQDIAQHAENSILSAEATAFCKSCIRQRGLDMKLVDVEVMHDRGKIIFYFTAPSRIDFRELVKDLVRNYRTRIELRQIGVRHETQMVGAIGNCGMVCCCHRYLRKFAPVTIKMAKEQNLFLNPAKLSGMCGRLLCCLSFEQGNYEEFNRRSPKLGKRYTTTQGMFKVLRANMFSRSIVAVNEAGEEQEFSLEAWDALEPQRAESFGQEQHRGEGGRRERREQARRGETRQEQPRENDAEPQQWQGPGEPAHGHHHPGRHPRKRGRQ